MAIYKILLIAVGLAMDAFAVSITSGITIKKLHVKHALIIALFFGSFQAFMPLIGWLTGQSLKTVIGGVDHWVAFGLLSFIGAKMIYESFEIKSIEDESTKNPLSLNVLLMLSIATSIDALAVGVSLSLLSVAIVVPSIIIGVVTFILSFIGVYIGNKFTAHFFQNKIEILGGVILIGIGVKILLEHL